MAELRSVRCPCGFEIRSRDEAEIIRVVRQHGTLIHGQDITDEQVRALMQSVA